MGSLEPMATRKRAPPERHLRRKPVLRDRRIVVVGIGYVGLPLAIFLARSGLKVLGVDVRKSVVDAVNEGTLPITEKDLERVFHEPAVRRNLRASDVAELADVFIICVPTPLAENAKKADLGFVLAALESLLPYLRKGNLVILESTVPPLTCRNVIAPAIEAGTGLKVDEDVGLVHCPERVFPGNLAHEIVHDNRVIGSRSQEAATRARDLYATFVKGGITLSDDVTAEFVKLIENSYRDVNIGLANELAAVAESVGIDVRAAIDIANQHPRVQIHRPGIGVGGHCIPVVPWFLAQVDPVHTRLIQLAREINGGMPERTASKIRAAVADVGEPTVVLVGMAYKPNTADTRESPALQVAEIVRRRGLRVRQFDPLIRGSEYASLTRAVEGADLLAILVAHRVVMEELAAKGAAIRASMRTPRVLVF